MVIGIGLKTGMYNIGGPECSNVDFTGNVGIYEGSSREAVGNFLREHGDTASREAGNYIRNKLGTLLEIRSDALNFLHDKCDIPMSHLEKYGQLKQSMIDSLSMIGYDMYLKAAGAAYSIPDWVKKTAGWWSERKVSDGEFVNGLTYMIKNKIIQVPEVASNVADKTQSIPDWVRNNAAYWSNGQITDMDFVNGIQYLIQHGIIQI